jgi:hypothetical protein
MTKAERIKVIKLATLERRKTQVPAESASTGDKDGFLARQSLNTTR